MYRNLNSIISSGSWYQNVCDSNFDDLALEVFRFQYRNNQVYQSYCNLLKVDPDTVFQITDIPFLPIHFFKTHAVKTTDFKAYEAVFESSGTTQSINSKHYIRSLPLYLDTCLQGFQSIFGAVSEYVFLCLLPSYLERKNSSLVYMAQHLIAESAQERSGFYLYDFQELAHTITILQQAGKKIVLLGVTFALLDFAEQFPMEMKHVIVIETGGMKGRKQEWTRTQVHAVLKKQWQLQQVYSEYGMTELLSQAYSLKGELFSPIATMKALVRDEYDPLSTFLTGKGVLNVIDLSNVYSCSFIATEDLGIVYDNQQFEVLGRMDHAALRGCSLMAI